MTMEQRHLVEATVKETKRRSGWPVSRTLLALGISRSTYYEWDSLKSRRAAGDGGRLTPPPVHAVLDEEVEKVLAYARLYPDLRHRELAWRMVDDDVAFLSPSAVYGILKANGLICAWPPAREKRERPEDAKATAPDQKWQGDIMYVKVGAHWYYLQTWMDEYSRTIVHHDLLMFMDEASVTLSMQKALDGLSPDRRPLSVQTDHGSAYISREFKVTLSYVGVGHELIHPHCPEENGLIERSNRTLREKIEEQELRDYAEAKERIARIIHWYNHVRLHSAIHFLTPFEMYRGNPEQKLEERRRKLAQARLTRREKNLGKRQTTLPLPTPDHPRSENPICPIP